jgi:hypothetical protein
MSGFLRVARARMREVSAGVGGMVWAGLCIGCGWECVCVAL